MCSILFCVMHSPFLHGWKEDLTYVKLSNSINKKASSRPRWIILGSWKTKSFFINQKKTHKENEIKQTLRSSNLGGTLFNNLLFIARLLKPPSLPNLVWCNKPLYFAFFQMERSLIGLEQIGLLYLRFINYIFIYGYTLYLAHLFMDMILTLSLS